MKTVNRPQFRLELPEELTWLKEDAGEDVAERWDYTLVATIRFIRKNAHVESSARHW